MSDARPNIIICTADQLRPFELGCYGNAVVQTPNVDRLASEGLRFETAVSNFPVCMAARSVLLSGQYNRTCTGGISNVSYEVDGGRHIMPEYPVRGRPHLQAPTIAEILRGEGYETAAIGKWHIHSWPHDIGFNQYLIPRVHHCHTGQSFTENGGQEFSPEGYSVDFEAGRVEQFLQGRQGEASPFFLYYNISVPHCPLADAPDRYMTMYKPEDIPLRANVDPDRAIKDQDFHFKVYRYDFRHYELGLPYADVLPDGYSLRHVIAEYCGMVSWMDEAVGRLLAALDQTGLAENTIVLFTADHGDNLGSHGMVQKGGANEESVRVPFIIRTAAAGGREARVNTSHVASLVDVAPTLLALTGIDIPSHFAGRDLSAACRGSSPHAADHAMIETSAGVAVRTPRHTYYVPYIDGSRELASSPGQYFDSEADPCQMSNLAGLADASDLDALLRCWDGETAWMPTGDDVGGWHASAAQ